jgi:hypothetical protein
VAPLLDAGVNAADAVAALLGRSDHVGQAAAHTVALAWVRARADTHRYRACLAPVPVTASLPPVPELHTLTQTPTALDPVAERAGALVEAAGAYSHLRRWVDEPEVSITRIAQGLADDAPATRVRILASLAAAQACLPDLALVSTSAVSAALEGDARTIEHHLRTAMAPVAARAHPPGTGRTAESLYSCWEPLLLGQERWVQAWDYDVLAVVDMLAPHLQAGSDDHLTAQLGVLALLWWHDWPGKPRRGEDPLLALAEMAAHPGAPERLGEAVAALESEYGESRQQQRTVVVQTALEQHLDHGGLAWAALAQWVRLAAHAPLPDHPVVPIPGQGPWRRAWQDADHLCEQAKPLWGPDSWDGVGVRVLIACALYTMRAQHPDAQDPEVLARTVWLLGGHERYYTRVPTALRALGHRVDGCDLADEVSCAWAWAHRAWPPAAAGNGRHRYGGYTRSVAWGGSQCAAHVLLRPWAHGIVEPVLARVIGAVPLGAQVQVRAGEHAGRRGRVVASRVEGDPSDALALARPPAQYKVQWSDAARGEGEVVDADHLTAL